MLTNGKGAANGSIDAVPYKRIVSATFPLTRGWPRGYPPDGGPPGGDGCAAHGVQNTEST